MNNNIQNINSLKIIAINVNSIVSIHKQQYLKTFLNENDPDVVLLNETKLNPKRRVQFENYKMIRVDRPESTLGGGTAILIKNQYSYKEIELRNIIKLTCLETTIVKLKLKRQQNLILISVYASQRNGDTFQTDIDNLFKKLHLDNTNNLYIIAGDLNAIHTSWKNKTNNPRGNTLNKWLTTNNIKFRTKLYHSETPSYPRTGSFLDICIADNRLPIDIERTSESLRTLTFDSDHTALLFEVTIDIDNEILLEEQNINQKFDYKRTNWKKFETHLIKNYLHHTRGEENLVPNNRTLENYEIDSYINKLGTIINETIEKTVPKIKSTDYLEKFQSTIVRKLQQNKRKAVQTLHKLYRTNQNKDYRKIRRTKALIANIDILIKENVRQNISKYWETKLKKITPSNNNMFPILNATFRKKESLKINTLKISHNDLIQLTGRQINDNKLQKDDQNNYIISENEHIGEIIGLTFQNKHNLIEKGYETFNELIKNSMQQLEQEINANRKTEFTNDKKANNIEDHQTENYFTTFENTKKLFTNLKSKLSTGIDNVPNIVLKHATDKLILQYTTIFNNALNNGYFPTKWKKAKIIAIRKPGKDPTDPNSYRPISLLPNVSKIFEKIIQEAILYTVTQNNILEDNQFGFRAGHSTIHATNKFVSDICWNINNRECIGATLIDLSDAFTTVWTEGLMYKLKNYNFPTHLIKMIKNMLKDKKFIIDINGVKLDKIFTIKNGLQQGTVTSPLLFILYINELLVKLNKIKGKKYSLAFADDIVIYTADCKADRIQKELQNMLNITQNYVDSWRLKINFNKCESIMFRNNLKLCHTTIRQNWRQFNVRAVNGHVCKNKNGVRYLGIWLKYNLNFHDHIKKQLEKANKAFHISRKLFYSRNISTKVKIIAYQAIIRPILTYGCQTWFNISDSIMEKMRKYERKCLRACVGKHRKANTQYKHYISNKNIYDSANIVRIDNFVIELVRKHYDRAPLQEKNNLIRHSVYPDDEYIKKAMKTGFIPPEGFIYLDKKGFLQNTTKIPSLYHIRRRATEKSITWSPNATSYRYSTETSKKDRKATNKKYW